MSAPDARSIVFDRAPWYWLLAFAGAPGLVALAGLARRRVRVRWSDAWVEVAGLAVARAAVTEVRRDATSVVLVAGNDRVLLVCDRAVRDADVESARVLAHALRVPFVDETGAPAPLPVARAR